MLRLAIPERPGWKAQAESLGFHFHTMYGAPYWDETRYYAFRLEQIERDIEDVSAELHAMALAAVEIAVGREDWLARLKIPPALWDFVRESWTRRDGPLYGRFDLAYDGEGPAKMLEYNADTPTSVYEAAFFQWLWLEERLADGALPLGRDQYNSIQDKLIARFGELFEAGTTVHFAACAGLVEERATVRYLEDCALQAGMIPRFVAMEDIGIDAAGRFADADSWVIDYCFKLYPWEDAFRDPFARHLPGAPTRWLEPPWKALLSNKGLLPLLWEMCPGHPNLLPAYFEDDPRAAEIGPRYVRKPLFSREGANISLHGLPGGPLETGGDYGAEGHVIQALAPLPRWQDDYPVIGAWIVGHLPAGMGIREDRSPITRDLSRFVPHVIL